jgi:hypothetical protein
VKSINTINKTVWICLLFCVGCHSGASSQSASDWTTGRDAFESIMTTAKVWSPDANAIRLFSGTCKQSPREGACNEWRAVLDSATKKKGVGFYWLGGVVTQGELFDYDPQDKQTGIEFPRIKADSDVAFRIAQEHGGRSLLEKNPATEIRYAMMWDKNVRHLVWLVLYGIRGSDISTAKLHVAADAETGDFLQ